jgi:hypothetical protein
LNQIRKRLTYANVMSSIAVFLVLAGGTAFAASQLAKNSVGTKQLKKNAVTAAKLKKNAVVTAKIRSGAVSRAKVKNDAINSAKIADGAVTGSDIDVSSTPFSRVVARLRGGSTGAVDNKGFVYPLDNPSYVQGAGEDNTYLAAVDLTFKDSCKAPRVAVAYLQVDAANPATIEVNSLIGIGQVEEKSGGVISRRIEIGPYPGYGGGRFAPATDTPRTLSLLVVGNCNGGGSGIDATFGGVDVIGTK